MCGNHIPYIQTQQTCGWMDGWSNTGNDDDDMMITDIWYIWNNPFRVTNEIFETRSHHQKQDGGGHVRCRRWSRAVGTCNGVENTPSDQRGLENGCHRRLIMRVGLFLVCYRLRIGIVGDTLQCICMCTSRVCMVLSRLYTHHSAIYVRTFMFWVHLELC